MRFETIQDYVDFVNDTLEIKWQRLDAFTSAHGFENYFVQNPITNYRDSMAMDELFGKLLNADAVVIIGDYAVKVDLPNEAVYVAPYDDLPANYSDLVAGNTVNKNVKAFSTDDDVIDYLLEGVTFKCGGSASFFESREIDDKNGGYFLFIARYFKAGIYNRVHIRVQHHWVGTPWFDVSNGNFYYNDLQFEVHVDTHWKSLRVRRRPCNNDSNTYHHGGVRNFTSFGAGSANPVERVFNVYEQTRTLNGYRVWVRGKVKIGGIDYFTEYFGKLVNSNF